MNGIGGGSPHDKHLTGDAEKREGKIPHKRIRTFPTLFLWMLIPTILGFIPHTAMADKIGCIWQSGHDPRILTKSDTSPASLQTFCDAEFPYLQAQLASYGYYDITPYPCVVPTGDACPKTGGDVYIQVDYKGYYKEGAVRTEYRQIGFYYRYRCADGSDYDFVTQLCQVVACPANSSRSNLYPYQCACNSGYKFDAVGGVCVPLRECSIPDLPPITDPEVQAFEDNPNRSDTSRLTPRMQTGLACLQSAAAAGSPSVGSAYRPPAYNQHLIDVWNKWDEFSKNKNYDQQDCAARKEKIRLHFKAHALLETQSPVPNSLHTKGEAVDVTINLPPANIDALAAGCHLRRPAPVKDRVHFTYQ